MILEVDNVMLSLYIVCSVIGLTLIVLSAFAGHHDFSFGAHDVQFDHGGPDIHVEHDVHVDHSGGSADNAGESGAWLPFFSLRFWTYLCAGFGFTGLLLTFFTKTEPGLAIWLSVGTGLVCGLMVAYIYRICQVASTDSTTHEKDILGAQAKVLVAIKENQPGRVRCCVKGDWVDFVAVSNDGSELHVGDEAVIVAMENGKALVIPKSAIFD